MTDIAKLCAQIDRATQIAETAGTSVVIPAQNMRVMLDYITYMVAELNKPAIPLQRIETNDPRLYDRPLIDVPGSAQEE